MMKMFWGETVPNLEDDQVTPFSVGDFINQDSFESIFDCMSISLVFFFSFFFSIFFLLFFLICFFKEKRDIGFFILFILDI